MRKLIAVLKDPPVIPDPDPVPPTDIPEEDIRPTHPPITH